MLSREACERRVFRLALLLLGDTDRAVRVIEAVLDAQPDLDELDSAHLDRLTVLRSREAAPRAKPVEHPFVERPVATALARLPAQPREAWVLSRVYRLPDREVARSMDCSVTATSRHRDQADAIMRDELGDRVGEGAESLLRLSMSLDVPALRRSRRERRRRMRIVGIAVAAVLIVAVIATIFLAVTGQAGG